jgi:hypothetical protein
MTFGTKRVGQLKNEENSIIGNICQLLVTLSNKLCDGRTERMGNIRKVYNIS